MFGCKRTGKAFIFLEEGQGAGAVHEPPVAQMRQGSQVRRHLLSLEPDESVWGDMKLAVETELWAIPVVTNASNIAHYISWGEVSYPIQKTSSCAQSICDPTLFIWKYSKICICFLFFLIKWMRLLILMI